MKKYLLILTGFGLMVAITSCNFQKKNSADHPQSSKPKNVLLIISDDLRPELNCYGTEGVHTPNIDRLAVRGITFDRAYVQQSVCSASRASFLTGVRPNTTGVDYPYSQYFLNEFLPDHPTISSYFFQQGYYARNFGKIHHGGDYDSLSAPYFNPHNEKAYLSRKYALPGNVITGLEKGRKSLPPVEMADVHDTIYQDGKTASEVIRTLRQIKDNDVPFILAVGFYKPHLPFNAPKKYWDLYDRDEIELAKNPQLPEGAPQYATTHYSLKAYDSEHSDPGKPLSDSAATTLKHGYLACVSYIDAQVGAITSELERLGLKENTIIVFISDHGWHLGEQGMWGKTTNYENATRAPMIISIPGTRYNDLHTDALVEYVDLFPTLIDASGLDTGIPEYFEGTSLLPLIENPDRAWKKAAFSQFPRGNIAKKEGYSIRTDKYRYTEWWDNENDVLMACELYDHTNDPMESVNLADHAGYEGVKDEMHRLMEKGWKGALPDGIVNNSNNPYAPRSVAHGVEGEGRRKVWADYLEQKKLQGEEPKLTFKRY